ERTYSITGDITYYDVGLGACGYDDSVQNDTGLFAAVSEEFWNSISTLTNAGPGLPSHPLCNKKVTLSAPDGTQVVVTVRDKCPSCAKEAIDVSRAAFKALFGNLDIGRTKVSWS
ncbi:RlpA-like double-psi beta-barrel-protein domain-containing protein-containing protein, partial [Microdochium trichocladiopsis]